MNMPPLWPHQVAGVDRFFDSLIAGHRRVCLTSPTGGGKTRTLSEIVRRYLARDKKVAWHTNRKMLLEQTAEVFEAYGFTAGKRAAGHFPESHHNFQLCSIQTETARTIKRKTWELHEADLAVFDEAHLMANTSSAKLMGRYLDGGGVILGATATPIDLGDFYDDLVVAGTNSELRKCGALVLAKHYGPDEPDLKQIGTLRPGEDVSDAKQRKLMGSVSTGDEEGCYHHLYPDDKIKALFGRVLENYQRLNPDNKPTILFAPGVKESLWFAQQFSEAGISAAHIDGEEVWVDGELHRSDRQVREQVMYASKKRIVKVICNRFVLREGIDAPWLQHGILATVFGSLQSFLQSGGRLLRAYPGMDSVTIQDHGGNWWRHGSLNADRQWELGCTNARLASAREDAFREKTVKEPVLCPQCKRVLNSLRCECGFVVSPTAKTRPVIMADGSLVEQKGDIYPTRRRMERPDTQKLWTQMYCRAYQGGRTFRQAEALFCHEQFYYPPRTLSLMPKNEGDWYRLVKSVPTEELIGPYPPWLEKWREKREKKEVDS